MSSPSSKYLYTICLCSTHYVCMFVVHCTNCRWLKELSYLTRPVVYGSSLAALWTVSRLGQYEPLRGGYTSCTFALPKQPVNNAITVTNVMHHQISSTCSGYKTSEFVYLPKVPVNMLPLSPCGHRSIDIMNI